MSAFETLTKSYDVYHTEHPTRGLEKTISALKCASTQRPHLYSLKVERDEGYDSEENCRPIPPPFHSRNKRHEPINKDHRPHTTAPVPASKSEEKTHPTEPREKRFPPPLPSGNVHRDGFKGSHSGVNHNPCCYSSVGYAPLSSGCAGPFPWPSPGPPSVQCRPFGYYDWGHPIQASLYPNWFPQFASCPICPHAVCQREYINAFHMGQSQFHPVAPKPIPRTPAFESGFRLLQPPPIPVTKEFEKENANIAMHWRNLDPESRKRVDIPPSLAPLVECEANPPPDTDDATGYRDFETAEDDTIDQELAHLLMAWYYSGYYTGRHTAFKQM